MKSSAKLIASVIAVFASLMFVEQTHSQQRRGRGPDVFKFLAEKYDTDNDGKLSPQEYDRSEENFKRFDTNKDGQLTADDWAGAKSGKRQRGGRRNHGADAAPSVGEKAPDLTLTHIQDAEKTVQLSSFSGSKPVALIFGSCT